MFNQKRNLLLESGGVCDIVSVHSGNPWGACQRHASIKRRSHTHMPLIYAVNTAIISCRLHRYLFARIGRGVVDNDKFKVRKGLLQH